MVDGDVRAQQVLLGQPCGEVRIPAGPFLLDAAAKVRYFWNGPVLAHEITPIVQGLLAGEPTDGMTDYAAPRAQ